MPTQRPVGDAAGAGTPPPEVFYGDIDGHRPLLTASEYELYRAQLSELRRVRDRDLPELLRDARGFVANDAAEEISQILVDQAVVDARIDQLERLLREARVISAEDSAHDVVAVGRTVTVRYSGSGAVATFEINGSGATGAGTASARSPVGRALLGRRAGDAVRVDLPGGRIEELEVLSVGDARAAAA